MPEHFVMVAESRLVKAVGDEVVQDWRCAMGMVERFGSYAEAEMKRTHREQMAAVEKPIHVPRGCREERRFWVGQIVPAEAPAEEQPEAEPSGG